MSSQTIDVSGLPEAVVRDLQRLVDTLRTATDGTTAPPREATPEEKAARFRAWAASHEKSDVLADDSRDSIYEGRGE
jgi:hypothetical protein